MIKAVKRMVISDSDLADDKILVNDEIAGLLMGPVIELQKEKRKVSVLEAKLKIAEFAKQRAMNRRAR